MARAAKTKTLSPAAGTQAALWRTGATGRQLSSLAGGSRGRGVSDAPGGRRHQHGALSVFRRRDDLGSGGSAAALDRIAGVPRALYTDWKNVYVRTATE